MRDKKHNIHDISWNNTKDDQMGITTKKVGKLSWMVFTKTWDNDTHRDEIYAFDIFENDEIIKQMKNALEENKTFKTFSKKLYSIIWGQYYGRYQYESSICTWPISITQEELTRMFEESVNNVYASLYPKTNSVKVSVGELIFFNWRPFAEYVWHNRHVLEKM